MSRRPLTKPTTDKLVSGVLSIWKKQIQEDPKRVRPSRMLKCSEAQLRDASKLLRPVILDRIEAKQRISFTVKEINSAIASAKKARPGGPAPVQSRYPTDGALLCIEYLGYYLETLESDFIESNHVPVATYLLPLVQDRYLESGYRTLRVFKDELAGAIKHAEQKLPLLKSREASIAKTPRKRVPYESDGLGCVIMSGRAGKVRRSNSFRG